MLDVFAMLSRMSPGSFVRLGFYFASRLIARALTRHRGLARFEANYCREDRLLPVSLDDRAIMQELSKCIACGLCDLAFETAGTVDRNVFHGPSELPLSYTRNLPDYDGLLAYLDHFERGDLQRLEEICPVQIPFPRLADFVRQRAQNIRASIAPAEH